MRFVVVCLLISIARPLFAQEPPPRIGPFVVDLHATVPRFPQDAQLADSRQPPDGPQLQLAELPGVGLGVQVGVHVYVWTWKAITFGVGGEYAASRARQTPPAGASLRAVTETFHTIAPQLSFNFGTGNGWSYVSGGIGGSTWSIVPDGQAPLPIDSDRTRTIDYGGGARWFIKRHLAFSFDVRFYQIDAGIPYFGNPGSPRTTLLIAGAGVSVK